jgi:hypothetical protein
VAIALLALAEVVFRFGFVPPVVGDAYSKYYPAYDYGLAGTPVCWHVSDQLSCSPTPYLDIWKQSLPFAKPRGELRVFTVGASVSRGDRRENYSAVLEGMLHEAHPDRPIRFVNLSARGIGSTRQRLLWHEALRHQPDLLLLHVHGSNEYEDERDRAYVATLHHGLGGLALQSRLVVALKRAYRAATSLASPVKPAADMPDEATETEDPAVRRRWLATLDENVGAMLAEAAAAHVPVILVGRAERLDDGKLSPYGVEVNDLLARRAGPSVRYFDAQAVFSAMPPAAARALFRDSVHWKAKGHRAVAEHLAPLIEAEILDAGPPR